MNHLDQYGHRGRQVLLATDCQGDSTERELRLIESKEVLKSSPEGGS